VRLASQLTGWDIDIMTEAEEAERRQKEFAERTQTFMDALDVDEVIAQLLASEGFATIEEIAYVELDEISGIEGFDEDTAQEIQDRAREYLERRESELDDRRRELGVEDAVTELPHLNAAMLVALGENDIKTVEDVADCAADDLLGYDERTDEGRKHIAGALEDFDLSREEAEDLIMRARVAAGWFTEEELEADRRAAEAEAEAEAETEEGESEAKTVAEG
jgi:N utilization substance protein A